MSKLLRGRKLSCTRVRLAHTGGLNGSTQHWLEVYSQESESIRFFSGVDLSTGPLCPDPTGYSRTGLFSSGSIVVTAHLCFRSSRVASTLRIAEVHFHIRGHRETLVSGHL